MTRRPLSNQSVYLLVLGIALAVAMLPVLWPQLDLAAAAFFQHAEPPFEPRHWLWVEPVNLYVPNIFRGLFFLFLAAWLVIALMRWRRASIHMAYIAIALALGPGLATWTVKELTSRARPFDVVEFGGDRHFAPALVTARECSNNCAFTSGHIACGFFLVSMMLPFPRRRWLWIGAGLLAGGLISLSRMAVGAHWLSDALWVLPLTLLASGVAWEVQGYLFKCRPRHAQTRA